MNASTDMQRSLRSALLAGLMLTLLTGCATRQAYRELVSDFAAAGHTTYYEHEAAPHPASSVAAADEGTSDFLDQVQRTIMETKERWEAALAEPSGTAGVGEPRVDSPEDYTALAHDSNLAERLAQDVRLETLVGLLPELNPGVQAAREDLRATLEQYPQAAYLDNILKQYNAFTKQLDTKIGPPRHKGMAAMGFPFPDALALKGRVVSEEVEIAQRQQEIALRDAATAMRAAYYGVLFVDAAITINRENQGLLEQMIKVAQAKIRVNKAQYNAVIMAQVELSKLADAIITLEERREALVAEINTLLNRSPDAPLGPPRPVADHDLALPLSELYDVVTRDRQELQQQRLRIAKMETMVELAARMAYPDPSTGASYFEDRMRLSSGTGEAAPPYATTRGLDHRQTAWFGQRDAYIREVKTRVKALDRTLAAMEDKARLEVKRAHFGLDTARRSIALYRQSLLPQARQALEAAGAGYRAGRTGFLTFLDAERTLLRFRLAEQGALRDHRTRLARLEQLGGHALPRRSFALNRQGGH